MANHKVKVCKKAVGELEKTLKILDSGIAEIKEIDWKIKAKVKTMALRGEKINKVKIKTLEEKMSGTQMLGNKTPNYWAKAELFKS
ncbi:hypothetical protein DSO57_1023825 [Entomophthora muscae]|uniref:Uncharacterized protein n=1 Tax=Entomophthora muscae TaxID=34485 RepID=A0ACC2UNB3_9FUNG|nr:hypothetical protein DSO57_1023825 [Entomophthora muscae]